MIDLVKRWWRMWVGWCSQVEPPEVLALFRVGTGLVLAWTNLSMLLWGAAIPILAGVSSGGAAPDGAGPAWFKLLGGATADTVPWWVGLAIALSLAVAAGAGGRVVVLALLWLMMALFSLHPGTGGGHDRLLTNALWLLFVGGGSATWSVDAWLRTGRWSDPTPILAFARRLAVWQVIYMYTLTGLQKQGESWFPAGDYRALYDTFLLPSWARYDLTAWVPTIYPLLQLSTAIAWWWESLWIVLGVHLLLRAPAWRDTAAGRINGRLPLRTVFLTLGVITHGTLWLLMDLGPFTAITLVYYVCLWTPEDTDALRSWWGRRRGEA